MPKITPIQESFAAGEISPKLLGRRSIDGYKSGVAEMTNMIADSRGPAITRDGFRFSQVITGDDVRLDILTLGAFSNFLIVWTDFLLTLTSVLGILPSANFIQNGDFIDGGDDWIDTANGGGASVDFTGGACILDSGNGAGDARISQQVTLTGVGIHTLIVGTSSQTAYRVKIGDTENSTDYFEVVTSQVRLDIQVDIQTLNPFVTIERISTDGGSRSILIGRITLTDDVSQLDFVTPYGEEEMKELFFVQAPDGKSVYVLHYEFPPHKLQLSAGVVSFGPVVFTNAPPQWDNDSFPGSGAVFQGRLWLGGTPQEQQTFWASKSGSLEDFTTGAADDDGLEFTLSQYGSIVWIMATKNLLIGTVNAEHVVSSEGVIITPTDVKIEQQSAYGSSRVQPIQVGDQVFYISLDGRKVRALQYEWSADNWLSKDLTFFSEHITASGIREISWAPNPDNLLVCTLGDGSMAWLTYERGENVWGWHRHVTDGAVLAVTVGVVGGTSITIAGIARVPGEIYIEFMYPFLSAFMDSFTVTQDLAVPFTVVTGLEHLEGKVVQVLADDAVAPSKTVVGGEITLDSPANTVVVGLKFTPKLVTLPLESGSPTGSSLAYLKRYNRLIIGLLDSSLPLINGVRAPDRSPSTPMNTREPNKTGQVDAYQLGWSEGAIVTIEQDLPLPLQVLYIGGELPQDVL